MAQTTWISDITNSTLNISLSTYSFQDALIPSGISWPYSSTYSYLDPPYLFQNGCSQPDGTQNCTASCQDVNQVFGSLDTLHNCMVYPTVADHYARSNLSNASLPEYFNIQKSEVGSTLNQNIANTIAACLIGLCDMTSGCTQGLNRYNATNPSSSPSNTTGSFYIWNGTGDSSFDICSYIPGSFDPDIGGIGVYVSYWIQSGLALLSFILVVWWNWGIYYVCFGPLLLRHGYTKAKKIAQKIRNNSRNKHLPSLTGALAEFQKAQCFFMLAINIAALVNKTTGGFQPNNLQQLYNTYVLIKSISISGYLPVTFTLFTLHLVDVVSWYLMILSIVTVVVSIATLFVIGSFSPSQADLTYLSQQALSGGPESCGTKNLAVYCLSTNGEEGDYNSINPASGAYSMLAFCLVVLILLVANQYHAFVDPSTGKPKPWLSKIINRFFRSRNHGIRRIQIVLALISMSLNGYAISWCVSGDIGYDSYYDNYESGSCPSLDVPEFVIFSCCWTLGFIIYLSLTSATAHTRNERSIGRFFNQKIAFAFDCLSAIFWFAGFIALAAFYQDGPCGYSGGGVCGAMIANVLVGVCLFISFAATTVFAARHFFRTRSDYSEKRTFGEQWWLLMQIKNHRLRRLLPEKVRWWRRLIGNLPTWKQMSRKLPSWTRHPLIVDTYTRLQQNTVPTMKVHVRRTYNDVKAHLLKLDWPSAIIAAAVFSLYLIFISLYINWFSVFFQDLAWFASNGVSSSSWSFGQIVAIMVWAEPLCEYFHLEIRGMTRGFEHRLWGYKLVKIMRPDIERGIVSHSTASAPPPSLSTSLDRQESGEYGKLGIVDSHPENSSARDGEDRDHEEDNSEYSDSEHGDLAIRHVPASREGSEDIEDLEDVREWQIPETVLLTSGSIAPF